MAAKSKPEKASEPFSRPPAAPKTLGKHGQTAWQRLAPLLCEMQLLTPLHLESFELLCDQWDLYQTKSIGIRKGSLSETFATDKGYEQRSPHAVARDKAFDSFMSLGAKFGLTPYALRSIQSKGSGGRGNAPADPVTAFAAAKYDED